MSHRAFQPILIALLCAALPAPAFGQSFSEDFGDITTLDSLGWALDNNSQPPGPIGFFQGNPNVFPAFEGPSNAYIAANFQSTAPDPSGMPSTISNWLILPQVLLSDADQLSFYTRTTNTPTYPDRLQVRLSLNGASVETGDTADSVGDFSTLLLDINPTYANDGYPDQWTRFDITLNNIASPTPGRLAFRYYCEDAGLLGQNSDYIGIDSLRYTAVPEPSVMALVLVAIAFARRAMRRDYPV